MSEPFESVWTDETKKRGLQLFYDVYTYLSSMGVHPMIQYGTLLGCCRDGNLIPWDGDFDICIDQEFQKYEPKFTRLRNLNYEVVCDGLYNYKVFCPKFGLNTTSHFKWPWVDIEFYRRVLPHPQSDAVEVHFLYGNGGTFYQCELPAVFPLEVHTFEGISVSTPKNPKSHLSAMYPDWDSLYQSSKVNHRQAQSNDETHTISIRDFHADNTRVGRV